MFAERGRPVEAKVLIVDDEKLIRFGFGEMLAIKGFNYIEAASGEEALALLRTHRLDAVLLDLMMPGMSGMETLRALREIDPDIPVIIVTAFGDVTTAVEATKQGAYDFIMKPPSFDDLALKLTRAIEKYDLSRRVKSLDDTLETSLQVTLGSSPAMKAVVQRVRQVAGSDLSVVMQGETGTGKTYISHMIHTLSSRAKGPFIDIDLSSIPETLVESEMFGYEKGAFTGAERSKKGYFEIAHGGTLFIDEIQNASAAIQSKLLRVVEDGSFWPVGASRPVDVDIRIITAANTDLSQAVREQRFREDLYYRLCEFVIAIPPLRERREDILLLAHRFCREGAEELGKQTPELTAEVEKVLSDYAWPGNIRELRNVLRRAILLCDGGVLLPEHISFLSPTQSGEVVGTSAGDLTARSLAEWEQLAIRHALQINSGNKSRAAACLKIDYKTLLRKIKQYGIMP